MDNHMISPQAVQTALEEKDQRITELERRLAETEASLQALIDQQVDAVLTSENTVPLLLQQAQQALQRSNEELEQRVAERTVALEQANAALKRELDERIRAEERFRTVWEITLDAMALSDPQGIVVAANPAYCHLYGFSQEEVVGQDFAIIYPEEQREWARQAYQETFANPVIPPVFEVTIQQKNGEKRCVESRIAFITQDGQRIAMFSVIHDVTERKQADEERQKYTEALRESEEKFRGAFQDAAIGFAMTTPEGRFLDANPAYCALTGYSIEELRTFTFQQLVHPDDRSENLELNRQMGANVIAGFIVENRYIRKDGQVVWVRKSISQAKSAEGVPKWNIALVENITRRKRAELLLTERNLALEQAQNDLINERNRLMAVMESLPVGLAIYDQKGGVIQSNPGFEAVWGTPRPNIYSVNDYDLYKAWWVETGQRVKPEEWASARAVQKGETVTGQYIQIQRFDGTKGYILNSGAPVRDAQGKIIGGVVAIMDITEQKLLEIEQEESEMQMVIQRRLMEFREQERQEIARDLHDGPIQMISGTIFHLQAAREAVQDPVIKIDLEQAALNLKGAVRELRDTMNELRPPAIIRFGFSKTARMHVEDFRERHPELKFTLNMFDDGDLLPESTRLVLFRILQESLNNITKHANASRVWVRLTKKGKVVHLQIRDNGTGFAVPADLVLQTQSGHYGLAGMKERAEACGGRFSVTSQPGKGTTTLISVKIPE